MAEKYWYGGAVNHRGDWAFGGIDPFNLDAGNASNVNGLVGLPAVGHTLTPGDSITIAGTDNFDGTYTVHAATTADTIVIPVPFAVLSGINSICAGNQWTVAGIDLYASGVQPGMKIKLWDSGDNLLGLKLSGTNGIVAGTQFTAAGVDFEVVGVQPGMTVKLWDSFNTFLGEFSIVSVIDPGHLELEQTGLSQSGLRWEIMLHDPETFEGLLIINVIDSGHLQVENAGVAASGLRYEIIRSETFDGTEIVTCDGDSNWKLVADGGNTSKPIDGDIIHFNDRAYYIKSESKFQGCTVNINAAGTGTPNLGGIFVSAGFNGNIGSETNLLEVNCEGKDVVVDGDCTMHLKLSAGADSDAGCGRLVVNNEKANVHVSSLLNNESNVCLYNLLVCLKGFLWVKDNCAVSQILSANYNSSVDGGVGIENRKDDTLCSISAVKGDIVWRSKIDHLELFDAKFAWGSSGMQTATDYCCNLLTIYSKSGEFLWQMADSGQSLIKRMVLYAGNLIASPSVNSGYRKRIGTGTEISELWPDASANLNSSSNNVLIAEGSKLEAHGGTLIASSGSLLEW